MHPFSVMQSFPTGRFVTLCFYCFFWLKSFFPGIKKTALRLFGTGFEPPNKYKAFQATSRISVRKSVHIENSYPLSRTSKSHFPSLPIPSLERCLTSRSFSYTLQKVGAIGAKCATI